MKQTHTDTPTPWFATQQDDATHLWEVYESVTDDCIADGLLQANARLIAAAPELLEALALALPFIEAKEGTSDENDIIVDKARAAILKATGGL